MADAPRRFPPPWRADKIPGGGYVVRDANGQKLAYIYSRATLVEAMQCGQGGWGQRSTCPRLARQCCPYGLLQLPARFKSAVVRLCLPSYAQLTRQPPPIDTGEVVRPWVHSGRWGMGGWGEAGTGSLGKSSGRVAFPVEGITSTQAR
jgi:hypothetical protein